MNKEQIVTSFGTILEMLHDRKHALPPNVSAANLAETLAAETVMKQVVEVDIGTTRVIYFTPQKFKWAELKKYFEDIEGVSHVILVLCENLTQNNIKSIQTCSVPIEIHLISRLQFNITKHVLVPKHEVIIDKHEIDKIVQDYRLKSRHQLPVLLKNDPIARWYAMKTGDVVKITRPSETAGEYIIYRCCL